MVYASSILACTTKYKNMKNLNEIRLKKEVQERVLMNNGDVLFSLQQVKAQLYKEWDYLYDNDRLVQAFDCQRDMKVVDKWIKLEKNI
tara:strand:- start:2005 stop:2268 length:264 start_codon:yes stop_codon:yes gene_type:complete